MISGVHQVSLYVKDQDAALRFWTESMGCTVASDAEYGEGNRWLEVLTPDKRMRLVLSTMQPGMAHAEVPDEMPHSNVFFYADDLQAAHRDLAAKGVRFPTPPTEQHWGWWAVFQDNEGTRYALSQRED